MDQKLKMTFTAEHSSTLNPMGDMIYTSLKLLNLLKANLAGMFFEWFILCYADKKKIKIEKGNRTQLESIKNMFFLEIAMTKSTVNTYVNMDDKLGGYRHK